MSEHNGLSIPETATEAQARFIGHLWDQFRANMEVDEPLSYKRQLGMFLEWSLPGDHRPSDETISRVRAAEPELRRYVYDYVQQRVDGQSPSLTIDMFKRAPRIIRLQSGRIVPLQHIDVRKLAREFVRSREWCDDCAE